MAHQSESHPTNNGSSEQAPTPKVVLEIGVGSHPVPPQPTMLFDASGHRAQRFPRGERMYVGIDMPTFGEIPEGDEDLRPASKEEREIAYDALKDIQQIFRRAAPDEAINFMAADGESLPLAAESVDEVYMGDVLSAQESPFAVATIIAEASRVLKPGGRLVMRETVTPEAFPVNEAAQILDLFGLTVQESAKGLTTERYQELQQEYGVSFFETTDDPANNPVINPDAMYFMIAEKASPAVDQ